ncbi:substrate-binding domain-containing protein [Carboxylicivirga sp. N1Y90]|uniref:substrate-binding domain-containing protein n=1 Tax=Carboxylicivirga fragile TaxID=3417571 RepID=UPI003D333254|nr:substrate-binding domain-containing protein [Marinilabiliaceae bacterium N1Y90]
MDTKKTSYTIKEIAEMAQVSRATVDRVIHGRGTVSKKAYDKIKYILDKIDYKPNIVAQTLRKGELFKVAVLMPDSDFDVYWKRAIDGINKVVEELSFIGVSVDLHLFNPFKEISFNHHAKQILKGGYSGVLVAPVFYSEAVAFLNECKKLSLPMVTFNTHIKDDNVLCHVGQDLEKSGRTAAALLAKLLKAGDEYLLVHIDEDIHNAKHIQEKEDGFLDYFSESGGRNPNIHTLKIEDTKELEKRLLGVLDDHPEIKGIFVSTSKVYYVAELVHSYNLNVHVLGYDLIKENVDFLNSGHIDFIIYQNPGLQASTAISLLLDHLAFKKEIPKLKYLPIEIAIKENYMDYITD